MKHLKSVVVLMLLVSGCSMFGARADEPDEQQWKNLKLWYDEPAQEWTEALPVGNGRLGAMVFGKVETERLQLNEDTLWAGHPVERDRRAGSRRCLQIPARGETAYFRRQIR